MSDQHKITDADRAIAAQVHREMKFRYPPSSVTGARRFNMEGELARTAMLARTAALKPAEPAESVDPDIAEAEKLGDAWFKGSYNRREASLKAIKRGRELERAETSAPKKPAKRDPEVGSIWQHYNGNRYQVIAIANQLDTEKYPKSIVHQNIRNKFVSVRRADDWHRSHTYLGHWHGCDVATDSDLSKSEELRKEFEA